MNMFVMVVTLDTAPHPCRVVCVVVVVVVIVVVVVVHDDDGSPCG